MPASQIPNFLTQIPAVVAAHGRAAVLTADGERRILDVAQVAHALRGAPPALLVQAPATFRRLGMTGPALDLLELFVFVRPGQSAPPTPRGLASVLDIDLPRPGLDADVALLPEIAAVLLRLLAAGRTAPVNRDAPGLAARMGQAGWPWAAPVLAALGVPDAAAATEGLRVWRRLPEWEETAPAAHGVGEAEARGRLAMMLGPSAEQRPGQADYAGAAAAAFAPRDVRGDPVVVLAEAGTGTGKTLGYIAPASLWANRNKGAVWISTFTRHLQRQIDAELARLYPDPVEHRHHRQEILHPHHLHAGNSSNGRRIDRK